MTFEIAGAIRAFHTEADDYRFRRSTGAAASFAVDSFAHDVARHATDTSDNLSRNLLMRNCSAR